MYDQILFDDPTISGYQPALPDGFDLDALADEVQKEQQAGARKRMPPLR